MVNLNQLEGSQLSGSSEDLSSTLSQLSVTATPSGCQRLGTPSNVTPTASPIKKKKRYYVVTVGKCARVFYNDWYVVYFHLFVIFHLLKTYNSYRDNVKPLVDFVSGARFQSYSSQEDALAAYKYSKSMGLVRIVRDPSDDARYGPLFYAAQ